MSLTAEDKILKGNVVATLRDWVKEKVNEKVSDVAYDSTNKKLTQTINGVTTDIVSADNVAGGTSGSTNLITSGAVNSGLASINAAKANKATTLAGYGITDAKIASGVITLGSNTITPLTSHQDISGKQDKSTAVTHTASTAAGSATQPVYVNSSGVATATTYSLNKTVPSDAVFTDTVTTATTSGSGNAVTAITASNGALTVTKGTTFLTEHQDISGKQDVIDSSHKLSASLVSGLGSVATSNSYDDLDDKPTIPSKTSDLENDSGFLTEHQSLAAYRTSSAQDTIDEGKVDKVTGKGLSTNDYTTADKTKLAGIEAGAEANVNADWNATEGDAQILNKPTIPTEVTENTVANWGFTKNAGTITGIKMNGASKGSSGEVDLGTVITEHQDISGKTDKSTLTTTGDIYYASAASTPARLGIGSSGQILTVSNGVPTWADAPETGVTDVKLNNTSVVTSGVASLTADTVAGGTSGSSNLITSGAVNSGLSSVAAAAEQLTNKITSITSSSTDTQYPSAKAVYDFVMAAIQSAIAASY